MALVFVVSYDRDRGIFQEDDSRIFISCFYLSLIYFNRQSTNFCILVLSFSVVYRRVINFVV